MKRTLLILSLTSVSFFTLAQDKEEEEKRPFKENLFTGGSISLAFYNNTFLVGASPVFGYSLTNWADAGVVVNYNYTSYRDVTEFNDRLRQTVYGGGAFVKLYPVRFLFAQAQVEHNIIRQRYIPAPNGSYLPEKVKYNANSFLIGGGYTSGRDGRGGDPFYYLAVLFDVGGDLLSPYTDAHGRTIPIIRAGLQVPLFQGQGRNKRDD
ncbi:MAG TPA: hypothetical protein VGO58_02225 [Chitinophagaceae bacterium]|jgi:hypothetical protein|nr:hypothetical protein [Chitinophagaceae bacterium]